MRLFSEFNVSFTFTSVSTESPCQRDLLNVDDNIDDSDCTCDNCGMFDFDDLIVKTAPGMLNNSSTTMLDELLYISAAFRLYVDVTVTPVSISQVFPLFLDFFSWPLLRSNKHL